MSAPKRYVRESHLVERVAERGPKHLKRCTRGLAIAAYTKRCIGESANVGAKAVMSANDSSIEGCDKGSEVLKRCIVIQQSL